VGLRDYTMKGREYLDGPSLQIKADGAVLAGGKQLTTLPPGKWVHLEALLDLGEPGRAAPKTYRLSLAVADQPPRVFDSLPYAHPEFAQLTWLGFSSTGKPGSVFYVDNVRLERVESRR
jgi:hypothetical protein